MSRTKAKHEAERWLKTAREDLSAARSLIRSSHFAQACFLCQQCAEKAVKAVWFSVDADPWGHSVQKLVAQMPRRSGEDLRKLENDAVALDRYYIPTRYPNGLPDLTPGKTFFLTDARKAAAAATRVLRYCGRTLRT